jgi:predicted dehydrogenase
MNRREILRTGSLGTLGLLASQTFQSARAQARVAGSNERIRIGIVGFSDRLTGTLLPAYQAVADQFNCEIVGGSNIRSRRREESKAYFSKNFGKEVPTYRNNEELYEKANLDAVIISSADFQHATHAIETIAAGCDVYCEKPFAETMQDNRAALKAVKSSDRILQVGSQRRSGQTYMAANEYLKSGKFGPIVAAEMT